MPKFEIRGHDSRDASGLVTPDPISNSAVKQLSADGSRTRFLRE